MNKASLSRLGCQHFVTDPPESVLHQGLSAFRLGESTGFSRGGARSQGQAVSLHTAGGRHLGWSLVGGASAHASLP